jgi:2-iminobutanoate/2-iminopropanoate deaminase
MHLLGDRPRSGAGVVSKRPFDCLRVMTQRPIHPDGLSLAHAFEVQGASRLLWIGGQSPEAHDGSVPGDFGGQARRVWQRIEEQLTAAGLGLNNLVKLTTFLSDRRYLVDNTCIRHEMLGAHRPALSVLIAEPTDPRWLIEIEAVAAA